MNGIQIEKVNMDDVPKTGRSSKYNKVLEEAMELDKDKVLKVTSDTNKHLRNTFYQLLKKREIKELEVISAGGVVYLKKI